MRTSFVLWIEDGGYDFLCRRIFFGKGGVWGYFFIFLLVSGRVVALERNR